jgi:hypothetical protein
MHIHIQAQEQDGRRFETVERDSYHADTARVVILRCGGTILGDTHCRKDYQTCKRAIFEHRAS